MSDHFEFERWKGIKADSGRWYNAIEPIATGRNAATFLAMGVSEPQVGIPYAIKVFRRISSQESRKAFDEESIFLERLSYPSIMRIYDRGTFYTNNPFIVAEYLPYTLRNVIQNGTTIQTKIHYALQLVSAIQYLSQLSPPVIHRDLKPENIFVRGSSCIIGDFGLKKVLQLELEEDADAVKMSEGPGMPRRYRTPELIRYYKKEAAVDLSRSDIFQLGLTLAELFTGENPLVPVDDYADRLELNKIGRINAGEVAAGIVGLIKKMIEVAPSKRPTPKSLVNSWKSIFKEVMDKSLYLNQPVLAESQTRFKERVLR